MKKELLYVTSNDGKFAEAARYIERHEPSITLKQVDIDVPEVQSMDHRFVALDKAAKAWQALKQPLIIDDSGIYFKRWKQFPGVLTKFVAYGIGMEGLKCLFDEKDPAYFLLYLVYVDAQGQPHVFEGRCDGTLTKQYTGSVHPALSYDRCFIPDGLTKTYAELRSDPAYELYFYRVQALKSFLAWWQHGRRGSLEISC